MVEGAVRAPARRRFLLLLGWAGAVALVIAVFPVLVRGELPDPSAVGWNYSGIRRNRRVLASTCC